MGTSRTDLRAKRDETLTAASRPVRLWPPAVPAEKPLVLEADTIRRRQSPPVAANGPLLWRSANTASSRAATLMRARDVCVGLVLLILFLPLIVILAIMVKFADIGPPFYAHVRVGQNGRPFRCYKLRSMYWNAEERLNQLLRDNPGLRSEWARGRKLQNDPRVTRLGALLRSSSLDELPQLFNVLNGTMSLVGPRPIVQDELRMYGRHARYYLECKPGLTGVWQVTGRSGASYRRRIAADRLYARRKSLAFDWNILFSTIPVVLGRKGAC